MHGWIPIVDLSIYPPSNHLCIHHRRNIHFIYQYTQHRHIVNKSTIININILIILIIIIIIIIIVILIILIITIIITIIIVIIITIILLLLIIIIIVILIINNTSSTWSSTRLPSKRYRSQGQSIHPPRRSRCLQEEIGG